jgi:hypothetical protein
MFRIPGGYKNIDIDLIVDKFENTLKEFWNEETENYKSSNVMLEDIEEDVSESDQ